MFFDFINAFATFQNFVNKILIERLNLSIIVYLNDIIIYFKNETQYVENIKWILKSFKKTQIFFNMKKCKFFKNNIEFLNFIVSSKKMQMQQNKIEIIQNWFAFKNVFEIFEIFELCNFYKRFIKNFNKLTLFLIFMLKKSTKFHKKNLKKNEIEIKITIKNDYQTNF